MAARGKAPGILTDLSDKEIEALGYSGIDEDTIFESLEVDKRLADKAKTYPKWIRNFKKGRAKLKIEIMRQAVATMGTDTQVLKELIRTFNIITDDEPQKETHIEISLPENMKAKIKKGK